MIKKWTGLLLLGVLTAGALQADQLFGVVNFKQCIENSKLGKQEQATFDQMREQMVSSLETVQKSLQEVGAKMSDQEYMDGLSADAQGELRNKFQTLNNELVQNQTQYYQILNQAHMRMVQGLMDEVGAAAQEVAKAQNLKMVVADEALFYYAPETDVTKAVIAKMDATFTPAPVTPKTAEAAVEPAAKTAKVEEPAAAKSTKASASSSKSKSKSAAS